MTAENGKSVLFTPKVFRRIVLDAARDGASAEPCCRHAPPGGECGGCALQSQQYSTQIAAKRLALQTLWQTDLTAEELDRLDVVTSPDSFHYRTRMDYVASKGRFGLRRSGKFNYIVDLEECRLIPTIGFAAARAAYTRAVELALPDYNLRSHTGFLRYITVRCSPQGDLLLSAVTTTPTPDASDQIATAMEAVAHHAIAQTGVVGFHWLVNDSVADTSFGTPYRHWGAALLPMHVGARTLAIGPNTFFQNNIHLLLPLLDAVASAVGSSARVADLYGGVGTIALHLAEQCEQIICVESTEESSALAVHNMTANGVTNVEVVGADVADYLRLQPTGTFEVVVVDPPRNGLGPDVCRDLLRLVPQRIVYVSCNPITQRDDARILAAQYRMVSLRGYDMFPHTPHVESIAIFDRIA